MSIQHILVIDDDPLSREFLVEAITSMGFQASQAENGQDGFAKIQSNPPDLVFSDLRMPVEDGFSLVNKVADAFPGLPVVVVTAHGTVESAVEAMRSGAADFVLKPCTPDALQIVIDRIQRTLQLESENAYLRQEVMGDPEIVAQSGAMTATLESAGRIAKSKGTVLITGESGTGKERIAQYIHRESPRKNKAFIRVNCAALSEQLLESELFGHERGAFTGAHKSRQGRFELANGGTLMLDEIGEISPELQAKLLRVLEEEEFERVGGNRTLRVDVRVIATTNRVLADEVAKGNFREDLFYRLHVLPVHMEPLRERTADILPLAKHFATVYAAQNGMEAPEFAQDAIDRMHEWNWPGNVRELENVIQRAVVLLQNGRIEADDLVFGVASAPAEATGPYFENSRLANRRLSDIEREAILSTLHSAGGNKTEAARRLGVSARTLSNKMKIWRQAGLVA